MNMRYDSATVTSANEPREMGNTWQQCGASGALFCTLVLVRDRKQRSIKKRVAVHVLAGMVSSAYRSELRREFEATVLSCPPMTFSDPLLHNYGHHGAAVKVSYSACAEQSFVRETRLTIFLMVAFRLSGP